LYLIPNSQFEIANLEFISIILNKKTKKKLILENAFVVIEIIFIDFFFLVELDFILEFVNCF